MPKVADVVNRCDTGLVRGLSLQIIDELNLLVPNALVNFLISLSTWLAVRSTPFSSPKQSNHWRWPFRSGVQG
jgi:hypothetical protein